MRLLVDANLPPFLADILGPLAARYFVEAASIPRLYGHGIKDEVWIRRATEEGGATFLTLDKHIRKRPKEVQAMLASACVGIVLADQYQMDEDHDLAARILRRWPHILECMKAKPPAFYEFSYSWDARPPREWRGWEKIKALASRR